MNLAVARSPGLLALVRCLRAAALPSLAAAILAVACGPGASAGIERGTATAATAPWLELPTLVAMAAVSVAVLRLWPTFARAGPGTDWLLRWQRGPLCGLGAVIAGAALAVWSCSAMLTILLAAWLGAPADAHAALRPRFDSRPLLRVVGDTTVGALSGPTQLRELRLRPRAGPPQGGYVASHLEVLVDGELHTTAEFGQDRQLAILPPPNRPVTALTFRLQAGTVPLWLDDESVEAIAADGIPTVWNACLYAAVAGALLAWALALGALVGAVATLPTVGLVVGATLFVATFGGVGPLATAAPSLLRGRWLADEMLFRTAAPFLAVGCMAMILRMLLMRRQAR